MDVVLLFTLVIGLLIIGVPIAVALGISSVLFLLAFSDSSLASVAQTLFSAFKGHYTLLAIPFLFWHHRSLQLVVLHNGSSGFQLPVLGTCPADWPSPVFLHACFSQRCQALRQQRS